MSEPMEVTRYAIRLPDGKLCADLPDQKLMSPEYKTLPDGTCAYLWSTETAARSQINSIAYAMRHYGLGERFPELASVVEVNIRYTLRDLPAETDGEPVVEAEVEGMTTPRRWASLEDVPAGVDFRAAGLAVSPTWSKLPGGEFLQYAADPNETRPVMHNDISRVWGTDHGYVEVLPEQPEPRTWANAWDVPAGVSVKPVGWLSSGPVLTRKTDNTWNLPFGQNTDSYLEAVWNPTGTGFVEVLP